MISELKRILGKSIVWNKWRIDCLARLIPALIAVRTVNLREIALAMHGTAAVDAKYKRLVRFFAASEWDFLEGARKDYSQDIKNQKEQNESIRHQYMVKCHNLEIKIKALESRLVQANSAYEGTLANNNYLRSQILEQLGSMDNTNKLESKKRKDVYLESKLLLNSLDEKLTKLSNESIHKK